jgi:hypothetical protein
MSNIEKIAVNGDYIWVDKDAEIKEGELCIDGYMNILPFADLSELGLGYDKNTIHKIIAASTELNLKGIPTYVEWLALQKIKEISSKQFLSLGTLANIGDGFIIGYQTAEKELFTEDDVRKAILKSFLLGVEREQYSKELEEEIIEQLKKEKP